MKSITLDEKQAMIDRDARGADFDRRTAHATRNVARK